MRIKLLLSGAIAVALGLSSCNGGDAKLANDLAGTWKGETTSMMSGKNQKHERDGHKGKHDKDAKGEMSCTPTLTFVKTDGTNGGTLNISADYTLTKGVESVTTSTPVNATVKGNVVASGTWTVKDDDEVKVTIDPSKTEVSVDSTSLALSYATLTDAPQDSLISIKERVAANLESVIKPMLSARVQKLHEFDDVKINGNMMTLEIGHTKMTFNKE